jgi:soluble lytic murein transglycosylase
MRGSTHLSQSLLYALIRQESRFYAGAISPVGALGLLQVMPETFAKLDQKANLLAGSGAASDVEYLLDAERNIKALSIWWRDELGKDDQPSAIMLAVMKHNAGAGNVAKWTAIGPRDDLEYGVETVRFPETRGFLRSVLQDTMIVDAAGLFGSRS